MNVTKVVSCIKTPFRNAISAAQKGAEKSLFLSNPLKADYYETTGAMLRNVFSRHPSEFTKAYIESLPPEIYNECLRITTYVKQICSDAKMISEYGELVQSGLKKH